MDSVVEKDLRSVNINKIAGIDEAGRGCGAGPVVAAGVMLSPNHKIEGLNDSKKLSAKKRDYLAELIYERAIDIQIAEAHHKEIDEINILNATKKCIKSITKRFKCNPDIFVIDGVFSFKDEYSLDKPYMTLPKGDTLSENVAAASIIAKVYRDNYMKVAAHRVYPEYSFDKHKGYLTKAHIKALYEHGPCPIHRMTFTVKGIYIKDIKHG